MNFRCFETIEIPVLPLRDMVIYPHMIAPLFIGREISIKCIEFSMKNNKKILLISQKKSTIENPQENDLFTVGTVSVILQMLKLPDGTIKILVKGLKRAKITEIKKNNVYFLAIINYLKSPKINIIEKKVLIKTTLKQFEKYIKLNKKISIEILNSLKNINNLEKIGDIISAHIPLKLKDKQSILEMSKINKRLEFLMSIMETEINLLKIEKRIRNRIKRQMEKSQREYYLNEQIKAIQKELGDLDETLDEYKSLQKKINLAKMPKTACKKNKDRIKKLKMMSPISAEATVVRSYIDWMIQVPWYKRSKIKTDIKSAKEILDFDHFGLEKVKERILEYLAVQNRKNKIKGPILCLVGPPGVGKTSLGKSIARATGRKYIRMALGGIRDEAEIRGHRRTYIGSMPGKLIQNISKSGVKKSSFLLDEIDKISCDLRVDPASALLEVLDSEQNMSFNDHYLETDYDLSEVMFIATSNSMNIPAPLLDRMEIIQLSGYTEDEKLNIAKNYLRPKQIIENALKKRKISILDDALLKIIRYYTREAGVRNLERAIAKICRKSVKKITLDNNQKMIIINKKNLKEYLGIKKYTYGQRNKINKIGQVIGLAWTEVGGDLLTIESACIPGKGKLTYTGSLGEVMQESIQAALTVVRSQAHKLNIKKNFYEKNDIHVHVPEGATPKDGPSAGITMCTAIVSCLTNIPVKSEIAMTGEITLRGIILSIGGLKEKLIAAHRGGIKIVLIPQENIRDLEEIPKNIISNLSICPVNNIKEVLKLALERDPYIKTNLYKNIK
ncbi:ATP-dependent protease LA [Buchnera aphidicola (Cinara tujafilina)]|uniref:Lon protease n=1 Tax=Buchnera aphidicola (Cinara tujafilina) TaxID=261317 RepID=F7WZL3_9GAMM|nr:endopeptidase La [Buchnera aphidicola]AEH39880.1 ATP-dependent protease LA [Buchnera aphidicola (Cinara tujafilina)]